MKDLISIKKLTRDEILYLLDFSDELKNKNRNREIYKPLEGKTVVASFPPTSIRTKISFETGIYELGGNSINIQIDFEARDTVEDKIGHLNCWIDYMVVRYPKQEIIELIASQADFSVINAMSRESHPCEILGDLQTIRQRRSDLSSLKFVFVGEGANISNTWFEAAAKLNLNLTQVCPNGYEISKELFEYARLNSGGEIKITNDIGEGLKNADIILTDGWPPTNDNDEVYRSFMPYQLTLDKIKLANKNCIVNPCPPSTRGHEIADEVMKCDNFIGYNGKENLLHMQKAILASLSSK